MGGKRSGDQAEPRRSPDPRPLIETLLEMGYPLELIANDSGVDIKEVRAIRSSKLLPDLLAEHEQSEEGRDITKTEATQDLLGQSITLQGVPTSQDDKTADWRELTEEDLEEKVLDRSGVIDLILSWLRDTGQSADDKDSIGSALNEAQVDASKAIREQGLIPPIRLRRESALMLHRIALFSLGKRGRGGSSKYKVVKKTL